MFRVEVPIHVGDGIFRVEWESLFHQFIKDSPIEIFVFSNRSPGIGKVCRGDLSEQLIDLSWQVRGVRVGGMLENMIDQLRRNRFMPKFHKEFCHVRCDCFVPSQLEGSSRRKMKVGFLYSPREDDGAVLFIEHFQDFIVTGQTIELILSPIPHGLPGMHAEFVEQR